MLRTDPVIHHHVKSCHEHHHLLIQFIYSELISGDAIVQKIDELILSKKSKLTQSEFKGLNELLIQLIGHQLPYSRRFSHDKEGIFAKLKNYSALLSPNKETAYIHQLANQMWILSLQSYDFNDKFLQMPGPSEKEYSPLLFILKRLKHAVKVYARMIKRFIMHYKQDENVLFFLLKNRVQLDKIYNEHFVATILRKMFFRSLKRAELFIHTRYALRGFHHLLPFIKETFATL